MTDEDIEDEIEDDTFKVNVSQQQEQMAEIFNNWSELIKMPTIGPSHAFFQEFASYTKDLMILGQTLFNSQSNLNDYLKQMNMAYMNAIKEISERAPKQLLSKEDFDEYRKIAINAFEDTFTGLFRSNQFSVTYGKVSSSLLDLFKQMQKFAEKNMKILNLPTRNEMDEMLKDIHDLKRAIHEMERSGQNNNTRKDL